MQSRDPRWAKFWLNLGWFVATMVVLVVLLRFFRNPVILAALWTVGLVWGGWLAFKVSQIVFGPQQIELSEERSRAYLEQAQDYRTRIDQAMKRLSGPVGQEHLRQLANRVDALIETVEALVARIGYLSQDEAIRRDLQAAPKAIKRLEAQLAAETDDLMRHQLQRTLNSRRNQLEALEGLQNSIEQAEIQIESTLSQLGTIYSQLLTGQSTSHVADYNRLATDIDEEIHLLHDHLEALREVRLGEE
jgi:predicted  nucleic acid-binding Zn-ribbon protein